MCTLYYTEDRKRSLAHTSSSRQSRTRLRRKRHRMFPILSHLPHPQPLHSRVMVRSQLTCTSTPHFTQQHFTHTTPATTNITAHHSAKSSAAPTAHSAPPSAMAALRFLRPSSQQLSQTLYAPSTTALHIGHLNGLACASLACVRLRTHLPQRTMCPHGMHTWLRSRSMHTAHSRPRPLHAPPVASSLASPRVGHCSESSRASMI